uniref:BED-type domain-containing protein n=1 Tax=Toxoplasma gondii (strain ATCC 50861 / VEG) TaxID=432359 RepID=A0A0F7UQ24_TOXGV|nr:TPA: hypothetical protein BN1205_054150 [Toxoplasma gondii VEG]
MPGVRVWPERFVNRYTHPSVTFEAASSHPRCDGDHTQLNCLCCRVSCAFLSSIMEPSTSDEKDDIYEESQRGDNCCTGEQTPESVTQASLVQLSRRCSSPVYNFFRIYSHAAGKQARCVKCEQKFRFTGSTTVLFEHLKRKHGLDMLSEQRRRRKTATRPRAPLPPGGPLQDPVFDMERVKLETKFHSDEQLVCEEDSSFSTPSDFPSPAEASQGTDTPYLSSGSRSEEGGGRFDVQTECMSRGYVDASALSSVLRLTLDGETGSTPNTGGDNLSSCAVPAWWWYGPERSSACL